MTQEEKIKMLAEEVMGWETDFDDDGCMLFYRNGVGRGHFTDFNPYTNSADNDALVEAFVGKYDMPRGIVTDFHRFRVILSWWDTVDEYKYGVRTETIETFEPPYTTAKKNEAVCEAILQAIKEEA